MASSEWNLTFKEVRAKAPAWLTVAVLKEFCEDKAIQWTGKVTKAELVRLIGVWVAEQVQGTGDGFSLEETTVDEYEIDFSPYMEAAEGSTKPKPKPEASGGGGGDGNMAMLMAFFREMRQEDQQQRREDLAEQKRQEVQRRLDDQKRHDDQIKLMREMFRELQPGRDQNPVGAANVQVGAQAEGGGPPPPAVPPQVQVDRTPVNLPSVQFSTFSGNISEVDPFQWLEKVRSYAEFQRWTDVQLMNSVKMYLAGEALMKWNELTEADKVNWERARGVWLEKLIGERKTVFSNKLLALKQGKKSVYDYTNEFLRLAKFTYFSVANQTVNETDPYLLSSYIGGLDRALKADVLKASPANVTAAKNLAEKFESVNWSCREEQPKHREDGSMYHVGNKSPQTKGKGPRCYNCGKVGHFARDCEEQARDRSLECHRCGKEGHFARECNQKGSGQQDSSQARGRDKSRDGNQGPRGRSKSGGRYQNNWKGENRQYQNSGKSKSKGDQMNTVEGDTASGKGAKSNDSHTNDQNGDCNVIQGIEIEEEAASELPLPGGVNAVTRKTGQLSYLRCQINGQDVSMMLDCGATITLLSRALAEKFVPRKLWRQTTANPKGLGGDGRLAVEAEIEVEIRVGKIMEKHVILISGGMGGIPAILGTDFTGPCNSERFRYCAELANVHKEQGLVGVVQNSECAVCIYAEIYEFHHDVN